MDKVYEAAVNRAEELRLELKNINDFIEMYRRTRQILGLDSVEHKEIVIPSFSETDQRQGSEVTLENAPQADESRRKRVTDNPKPIDVVSAAAAVIEEQGRPLSRRELYEALKARGMEVRGADPVKTLGTMLWRSGQDSLVQLERYGYWIKDKPFELAKYVPDIKEVSPLNSIPDLLS